MTLPLAQILCEIAMRNTCALLGIDHKNNILKPSYINHLGKCENVSHATNHYCTAGGWEDSRNFSVFTKICERIHPEDSPGPILPSSVLYPKEYM
jgi:hypothetical protein